MEAAVAHRWAPIEDLPDDWSRLASAELRALAAVWEEQRKGLAGSPALARFTERLNRRWAIETGVIERVYTLDAGVTEQLVERGIDAALIPDEATDRDPTLVTEILHDHEASIEFLFDVVTGRRALTTSLVRELHALMTRHQDTARGRDQFGQVVDVGLLRGEWKIRPNNPTRPDGLVHQYCPPEQVAPEMDRLVLLHEDHERRGVAPEVEAAWLYHRFEQVHPFQDGNGRVGRALASLVLVNGGWFPLVVTRDEKDRYLDALRTADGHELAPLVELVAGSQRRAFVDALGTAGEVRQDSEGVDEVIASVREMLSSRHAALVQEWERAKRVADRALDLAEDRLGDVAKRLAEEIGSLSAGLQFSVDSSGNDGREKSGWYRWQRVEAARERKYFANTRDYSAWARLGLHGESDAEVLVSLTAIGREYRGLVGAVVIFFRRAKDDTADRPFDVAVASKELFQINYKEEERSALDRFLPWLDEGLVCALEMWREGL